ncbi:MAG: hydantoinase/oxoprolinase family protein [Pseudomonadota bacterium]
MSTHCRVGIDVGGTFTDFVLADEAGGRLTNFKVPSTQAEPSKAVTKGLAALMDQAELKADAIDLLVHGTTIALNAVVQRRGAEIGLVISKGFGDTILLARGGLPNTFSYKHPKPVPIIPRDRVFEIDARLRPDGTVRSEPSEDELTSLAGQIHEANLDAVGVLILNSYAHPDLEIRIANHLRELLPGILVTASAEFWPEIREYERALATSLNCFVQPLMDRYFGQLTERLDEMGVAAPLFVTASNGGTVSVSSARAEPIQTLLSGPAAGVVAAANLAGRLGLPKLVTIDMGGTSSDMAIIEDGEPATAMETKLGDLPIIMPVVDVWAIGAGGGSVIWTDAQGVMKVGPESAGADPGPICYGKGGDRPTVTDCYVALGLLDPAYFLGGRMTLDRQAAIGALAALGAKIGLTGPDAGAETARAALRIATAKMATEVSKGMAQRGLDPADFALMAYGGAGPTHAALLADEAHLSHIVIPPSPGTFCAFGALVADIRRDFIRSQRLTLGQDPNAGAEVSSILAGLEDQAQEWIAQEGGLADRVSIEVTADMQYPRTAFVLTVPIADSAWRSGDVEAIKESFHQEHERLYAFRHADSPVDITTLRVRVNGAVPTVNLSTSPNGAAGSASGTRPVYVGSGSWVDATIHMRAELPIDLAIGGPAVIEQDDTTIWVPPGWTASGDQSGCLHLRPTIQAES